MDKRKGIAILVAVLLAFGFNFLYNSTIIYWDAYGYEIFYTDVSEPDLTIEITNSDLLHYPEVASTLETAYADGWEMITFEDGDAMNQFDELIASKGGSMDTEPIYMMLTGVFMIIASGLVIHELVVNYMGWGRKTEPQ
jgi:hypothetical protein